MESICESSLALSLVELLPERLKAHSYSIMGLAQEMSQELECPLCEILTPMGEALVELATLHQIRYDHTQKHVMLA